MQTVKTVQNIIRCHSKTSISGNNGTNWGAGQVLAMLIRVRFRSDWLKLKLFIIDAWPAIVQCRLSLQRARFAVVVRLGQHLGRVVMVHVVAVQCATGNVARLGRHAEAGLSLGALLVVLQGKERVIRRGYNEKLFGYSHPWWAGWNTDWDTNRSWLSSL